MVTRSDLFTKKIKRRITAGGTKHKRNKPFSSSATSSDKSSSKLASPTCLIGRPTGSIAPPLKYSSGRSYVISRK